MELRHEQYTCLSIFLASRGGNGEQEMILAEYDIAVMGDDEQDVMIPRSKPMLMKNFLGHDRPRIMSHEIRSITALGRHWSTSACWGRYRH